MKRDEDLFEANRELVNLVKDPEIRERIGSIVRKHFILKADVKSEIVRIIDLLKLWECESERFTPEEQQRLNNFMNEEFRFLLTC